MNTSRYNGFWIVHKALRAMLYDTALRIQKTDFENETETEFCFAQVKETLQAYAQHALIEDGFILRLIEKESPALYESFTDEHGEDDELAEALIKLMAVCKTATGEKRRKMVEELHYRFYAFMAFNLDHMNREETELNAVLWQQYTDQELMATNQKISEQIADNSKRLMGIWLQKGCNEPEWQLSLNAMQPGVTSPLISQSVN